MHYRNSYVNNGGVKMLKKINIFKRVRELEEHREVTNKAFGVLVSEINMLKRKLGKTEPSTLEPKKCETPEEFMKSFISNLNMR